MYCMRVVHAQHMSCRDACVAHAAMVNCQTVGVRAGLHTNLADERERVERAGMVQMHHDGVVHDGQAPPAASSSHGACARPASFAPPVCSTREVSSKLVTGSSSSAAVGKTVARHAIEPRSSHGRHGGRERRGHCGAGAKRRRGEVFRPAVFFSPPQLTSRHPTSHGLTRNDTRCPDVVLSHLV